MLTPKGYWTLFLLGISVITGMFVVPTQWIVVYSGMAVIGWFFISWAFHLIIHLFALRKLPFKRTIDEMAANRKSLWSHRKVFIQLHIPSSLNWNWIGLVELQDWSPLSGHIQGSTVRSWDPRLESVRTISYHYTPQFAGSVRWEGSQIILTSRNGWFQTKQFIRHPIEVSVLPAINIRQSHSLKLKQRNIQVAHGLHRHQAAGSGAELFELRDYQPGDPPKRIAWKVSARRNKLITKEFEAEPPVRCRIFLDISESMRLGESNRTPLLRNIEWIAEYAKNTMEHRDPVGLSCFDESAMTIIDPGLGSRNRTKILSKLSNVAKMPLRPKSIDLPLIFSSANWFCQKVYPDLFDRTVNRPVTLLFRFYRFLRSWSWNKTFHYLGWLATTLMMISSFIILYVSGQSLWWMAIFILIYIVMIVLTIKKHSSNPTEFKINKRLRKIPFNRRKSLALALSSIKKLSAEHVAAWIQHDDIFSIELQRFLGERQVPFQRPSLNSNGEYAYLCEGKIEVLAKRLLQTVTRAKDNEQYILVVDLAHLVDRWEPLLRAIQVARSRKHEISVICPWPIEFVYPEYTEAGSEISIASKQKKKRARSKNDTKDIDPLRELYVEEKKRYREAFHTLNEALKKIRVPVIWDHPDQTMQQLVKQMERLRVAATDSALQYASSVK